MRASISDLGIDRLGLIAVPRSSVTFHDRLFLRIDTYGDCWVWTGTLDQNGYGVLGRGARGAGNIAAHRAVWETLIGPIPDGMTYDHRCRVHNCVNPDHAEIVPLKENILRGHGMSRRHADSETCGFGHPKDGWTTRRSGPQAGKGHRYCKTCARAKGKARYSRKVHAHGE